MTITEKFIETMAGFYRASAALDQVAVQHGGADFQREAYDEMKYLDKLIDGWLDSWNNSGDTPDGDFEFVDECKDVNEWGRDDCERYVVRGRVRCQPCAYRDKKEREAESGTWTPSEEQRSRTFRAMGL